MEYIPSENVEVRKRWFVVTLRWLSEGHCRGGGPFSVFKIYLVNRSIKRNGYRVEQLERSEAGGLGACPHKDLEG